MKKLMKKLILVGAAVAMLGGCAYGPIAVAGDKVVIARQDQLLFGALRKVFVCKVTDGGVTNCAGAENP